MNAWRSPGAFIALALALGIVGFPFSRAAAQEFEVMQNWSPGGFAVRCGDKSTLGSLAERFGLASEDCMDPAARATFTGLAKTMLDIYRREGFSPPYRFGPVIEGSDDDARMVRIFTSSDLPFASISPLSGTCDPTDRLVFTINPDTVNGYPRYVQAYITAHELFHTIQGNFPIHMRPGRAGALDCFPPDWITEGMADAVSISRARQYVPRFFPPRPGQKAGFSWAGLRPYNLPIYSPGIPKVMKYRTSSFWRYLAEFYHRGRLKFLESYSTTMPPGGKFDEDWLVWLDRALIADAAIQTPLSLVYPGFLTNFAGDWVKGGDGEKFGRSAWLRHGFGACTQATLSPGDPYVEIPVSVYPMAGKCISVRVEGLAPADRVSVKIGVLTSDEALADSLHLGFAFTNDRTGFNCAQLARAGKIPPGIAGCLLEPVTGTFESGGAARIWNATSLEVGPGPEQVARAGDTAIENVYILSRVPSKPRLSELRNSGAVPLTLAVGLEYASLTTDAGDANKGAADGTRKSRRKRVAAAMGANPTISDQRVPASVGYIDLGPVEAMLGQGVVDLMNASSTAFGAVNNNFPGLAGAAGIAVFQLAEAEVIPTGSPAPIDDESLEILREFTVAIKGPLTEGQTGTFKAYILGRTPKDSKLLAITKEGQEGRLTVLENSRGAFRARIQGQLCEFRILLIPSARSPECLREYSISGEISKPFAYLYRGSSQLVSRQTEGEKLYNRYLTLRNITGGVGGDQREGDGGGEDNGTPSSGTAQGGALPCECACPPTDEKEPLAKQCRELCAAQSAKCPPPEAAAPKPPTPTLAAQVKWFSRLVGDQGLSAEAEQMLVDDFATMSDETRAYLIKKYRDGVP